VFSLSYFGETRIIVENEKLLEMVDCVAFEDLSYVEIEELAGIGLSSVRLT
jgi:hypothetical protein